MSQSPASPQKSYRVRIAPTADGGGRVPDLSPREAWEMWLDKQRVSLREPSVSGYHYQLKLFVEWCEDQGIDSISSLTGWDIEAFETARRSDGLAPVTLQSQMKTLRRFLRYCVGLELVDESLPGKVNPPKAPRSAHVDDTRLTPRDAEMLLENYGITPDLKHSRAHALLAVAWYTGARLGAMRGLDLSDYHSDDHYLVFEHRPSEGTPLKNGPDGERAVGLPAEVADIIDGYVEKHRNEQFDDFGRRPLFTSQGGRASTNAIRAWMYLATHPCLHSDCPHGRERDTCEYVDYSHASKCQSSRSPHQVRTGSITWQLNRGVPIEVVSERVNASVRVIKEHYDKPDKLEEMEHRRRPHIGNLSFGSTEEEGR